MKEDENFNHKVFKNDPIYLLSLIDRYAAIETNYIQSCIKGFIDAIDPVTESVIITIFLNNKWKTILLMGHSIKSIVQEEPPEGCEPRIKPKPEEIDQEFATARKTAILNWLSINLLPVEDVDGIIQVHEGHLCIMPPYSPDDCISNNSIILGRIQHLLHNMPEQNQGDAQ